MKAKELANWLLEQEEDYEVLLWGYPHTDDVEGEWHPMEEHEMLLRK